MFFGNVHEKSWCNTVRNRRQAGGPVKYSNIFILLILFAAGCTDSQVPGTVETPIADGWVLTTPRLGADKGSTSFSVVCPHAGKSMPLTFGVPLGQVRSPHDITLLDSDGDPVPASYIPLGSWDTQPARWTLVSMIVDAEKDDQKLDYTLLWGKGSPPSADIPALGSVMTDNGLSVPAGDADCLISPSGLSLNGGQLASRSSITPKDGDESAPVAGTITKLHDTPGYALVRSESDLADSLILQTDYRIYAGSPQIECRTRFINRSLHNIPLDCVTPVKLTLDGGGHAVFGAYGMNPIESSSVTFRQRALEAEIEVDGIRFPVIDDGSTYLWVYLDSGESGGYLVVLPYFRGMAAGDSDVESTVSWDGEELKVAHYSPIAPTADVRLRETMARTFSWWVVVNPPEDRLSETARNIVERPRVVYDREYLTSMGVFQEKGVSHLFDNETLEGALYFSRARVPRGEYPRCSRATEPEYDGEGATEIDMHAGGMVFGEVYQYFTPKPDSGVIAKYTGLGIDKRHILTGGVYSYRNGDIPLALFQEYLRTGNRVVYDLATVHAQLFADYAVSHHNGPGSGLGHYYCDWYGNPYVYQRFEGLLLAYKVTGDPWLYEACTDMAEYTLRGWNDGAPRDALIAGEAGGIQSRSVYIAKMNLALYDFTSDRRHIENAVKLAEWAAKTPEPEGWWVMNPTDIDSRSYRCTPIFTGYIVQGLWPLFQRTGNEGLRTILLDAADWYLSMQEDATGNNPGTFPNSYWYGERGSEAEPVPVSGNYATSTHAANALLQAFLATGDQRFFYASNAAWAGILNHQTSEGGIPLENTAVNSVWSHVVIESLPDFGQAAESHGLPAVLSSKTGVPGTSFMGRGASWDGSVFTFGMKYMHDRSVPVRVYFPYAVSSIIIDGKPISEWAAADNGVVTFMLPPSGEFNTAEIVITSG